jgi:hypothetical protein
MVMVVAVAVLVVLMVMNMFRFMTIALCRWVDPPSRGRVLPRSFVPVAPGRRGFRS